MVRLKQLQAEREVSQQPSASHTHTVSGDASPQRTEGDATSRALALISHALNSRHAASAGVTGVNEKAQAQSQPQAGAQSGEAGLPAQLPSTGDKQKPKRGAASKAVKGPILL